mgnify:CR=1 FL=1
MQSRRSLTQIRHYHCHCTLPILVLLFFFFATVHLQGWWCSEKIPKVVQEKGWENCPTSPNGKQCRWVRSKKYQGHLHQWYLKSPLPNPFQLPHWLPFYPCLFSSLLTSKVPLHFRSAHSSHRPWIGPTNLPQAVLGWCTGNNIYIQKIQYPKRCLELAQYSQVCINCGKESKRKVWIYGKHWCVRTSTALEHINCLQTASWSTDFGPHLLRIFFKLELIFRPPKKNKTLNKTRFGWANRTANKKPLTLLITGL